MNRLKPTPARTMNNTSRPARRLELRNHWKSGRSALGTSATDGASPRPGPARIDDGRSDDEGVGAPARPLEVRDQRIPGVPELGDRVTVDVDALVHDDGHPVSSGAAPGGTLRLLSTIGVTRAQRNLRLVCHART